MELRLGVIGDPVSHSLSPRLHETALATFGLPGASRALRLNESDSAAIDALPTMFDALSVTAPLKRSIFVRCDEIDEDASELESVNSVKFVGGKWLGRNTDGQGFCDAVEVTADYLIDGSHIAILGSGPSAEAITRSLLARGASNLVLHSRNERTAENIARKYRNVATSAIVYRPLDMVINTIPSSTRSPIAAPLQGVTPDTIAIDITYGGDHQWLDIHERYGCRVFDGKPMLAFQAALQLTWWLGVDIAGTALLEAIS